MSFLPKTLLALALLAFQSTFAIENDECSQATVIVPSSTCVFQSFTTQGGTMSTETAPGCSTLLPGGSDVWFQFTMPADGQIQVEIVGSAGTNPDLALYSGSCGSLTPLACEGAVITLNDVSLAGETIFVRVWNLGNSTPGNFTMCVQDVTAPANDFCEDAIALDVNTTCVPYTASNKFGTMDLTFPNPGCSFLSSSGSDVWFTVEVPASGKLQVQIASDAGLNHDLAIYEGTCSNLTPIDCDGSFSIFNDINMAGMTLYVRVWSIGTSALGPFSICAFEPVVPDNDFCSLSETLPVNADCNYSAHTNAFATDSPEAPFPSCGFYSGGDVWFNFEMPASGTARIKIQQNGSTNPEFTVYEGSCASLTPLGCNAEDYVIINRPDLIGETLLIRVYTLGSPAGGTFNICIEEINLVPNDNCAGAIEITPQTTCVPSTFSNLNATATSGVPAPTCGAYFGSDVWFKFTAPASGQFTISLTAGTNTLPSMTLFTGTCGNLTTYYCGASNSFNDPSVGGAEMYIRVWRSFSSVGGTFSLCIIDQLAPDNDFCSNATLLTVGSSCNMTLGGNQYSTSLEPSTVPNPTCGFYSGGDVWFQVLVPASGHLFIDTDPIDFSNIALAAYVGDCTSLTHYACDASSSNNGNHGELTIHDAALAGQFLYIRAFRVGSPSGGTFTICASEPNIPNNDFCASAIPLFVNGGFCNMASFSNQYTTSVEPFSVPNPTCGFYSGADVWFTVEVPSSGQMVIDLAQGTNLSPNIALYSGTCGNLTQLACDFSSSEAGNTVGKIVFNNLAYAGQTLYVRIFRYGSSDGGTFGICAYDPSGCGFGDILLGNQSGCVPQNNFYTQTLTISYQSAPVTGSMVINGQSFAVTGSPQTITLTGLYSDALAVDLVATFTDAPACLSEITAAWVAPVSCCLTDFNGDGVNNTSDFLEFTTQLGCTGVCQGDFDGNGEVSVADLLIMLALYGQPCP